MCLRCWIVTLVLVVAGCGRKGSGSGPRSPQEEVKSFHLNDDFNIEVFVSEPNVMSPVEMVFDENGRIYVAEMLDYPADPPPGKPARSRIRLLDTDDQGKIVRATVFAENVLEVSGIMPWKGGLVVTSAPDILYMKDTNGDGKADIREVLYTGFLKAGRPRAAGPNWRGT